MALTTQEDHFGCGESGSGKPMENAKRDRGPNSERRVDPGGVRPVQRRKAKLQPVGPRRRKRRRRGLPSRKGAAFAPCATKRETHVGFERAASQGRSGTWRPKWSESRIVRHVSTSSKHTRKRHKAHMGGHVSDTGPMWMEPP